MVEVETCGKLTPNAAPPGDRTRPMPEIACGDSIASLRGTVGVNQSSQAPLMLTDARSPTSLDPHQRYGFR